MTLFDQIERLTQDKEAIRTSLNEKGCNIGEEVSLDDYANIITNSDLGSGSSELLLKDYPITYKLDGDTYKVIDKENLRMYTYQYYRIHYKDLTLNTLENELILNEDYNGNIIISEKYSFEHDIVERIITYKGLKFLCIDDLQNLKDIKFDALIVYNYRKKENVYGQHYFYSYLKENDARKDFLGVSSYSYKNFLTPDSGTVDSIPETYKIENLIDKNENDEYYSYYSLNKNYYYKFTSLDDKQWPFSFYIHITD